MILIKNLSAKTSLIALGDEKKFVNKSFTEFANSKKNEKYSKKKHSKEPFLPQIFTEKSAVLVRSRFSLKEMHIGLINCEKAQN